MIDHVCTRFLDMKVFPVSSGSHLYLAATWVSVFVSVFLAALAHQWILNRRKERIQSPVEEGRRRSGPELVGNGGTIACATGEERAPVEMRLYSIRDGSDLANIGSNVDDEEDAVFRRSSFGIQDFLDLGSCLDDDTLETLSPEHIEGGFDALYPTLDERSMSSSPLGRNGSHFKNICFLGSVCVDSDDTDRIARSMLSHPSISEKSKKKAHFRLSKESSLNDNEDEDGTVGEHKYGRPPVCPGATGPPDMDAAETDSILLRLDFTSKNPPMPKKSALLSDSRTKKPKHISFSSVVMVKTTSVRAEDRRGDWYNMYGAYNSDSDEEDSNDNYDGNQLDKTAEVRLQRRIDEFIEAGQQLV